MTTLYLDRRDLRLKQQAGALQIHIPDERPRSVPLALLDRIVLRGNVALDSGLLGSLSEAGISVLMLSGRHGRRRALLAAGNHGDAARRIAQYRLYDDADWRKHWSRRLVLHKLAAQRRMLRSALQRRSDQRRPLLRALATLQQLNDELRNAETAPELERLLGIEGAAAAAGFKALGRLLPASVGFKGRNRRPPKDPANACLSLAYTLLHFDAVQACHGAGLDPLIGYYHKLSHGRESLASDLIEPLRPRVDRFVLELFRSQQLRASHFRSVDGGCLLGKTGRGHFFAAWESYAGPHRRLLRRGCTLLARHLKDMPL